MQDVADIVEQTYREQADRLWRAVVLFSGDPEIASDAVSEAFAQAIARGSAIDHLDRWIWRSAFLIARGELKARRRHTHDLPDLPQEVPADTVDLVKLKALMRVILASDVA